MTVSLPVLWRPILIHIICSIFCCPSDRATSRDGDVYFASNVLHVNTTRRACSFVFPRRPAAGVVLLSDVRCTGFDLISTVKHQARVLSATSVSQCKHISRHWSHKENITSFPSPEFKRIKLKFSDGLIESRAAATSIHRGLRHKCENDSANVNLMK